MLRVYINICCLSIWFCTCLSNFIQTGTNPHPRVGEVVGEKEKKADDFSWTGKGAQSREKEKVYRAGLNIRGPHTNVSCNRHQSINKLLKTLSLRHIGSAAEVSGHFGMLPKCPKTKDTSVVLTSCVQWKYNRPSVHLPNYRSNLKIYVIIRYLTARIAKDYPVLHNQRHLLT